ncbi:SCP-like protein [Oesophagostomum dentatum]|uniref:SCP-like protein n=1 Tax=Oesophagostomum dentatum TaxID=61180 RepID=A0A0B1TLN7_OESDE|nr:SCP-like protein [Oesophagostomum dentatum]
MLRLNITENDNTICPDNEGMTDSLRIALWAKHNALRSSLALGAVNNGKTNNTCRKASKMPQLTADTTAATAVTQVQGTTEGSTDVTSTTTTLTTTTTTTATMESESALPGTVTAEQDNTICPDNEGMTDSLRIALWAKHNTLRSSLALGAVNNGKTNNTCRKASKMPQLIYCCELEKKAMERASQCDQMDSTPQGNVSENNWNFTEKIDRELTDAGKAVSQRWWSEITKLESGIDQIQNLYYTHFGINSFAKMASELTTGVGCAVVRCENRINVVCHYDTTLGNGMKLYTVGPTCNKCENGTSSCVNGLCPAASATCSIATTTATPEATTTSGMQTQPTAEPNTQCPENHGMTDPLRLAFLTKHNTLR